MCSHQLLPIGHTYYHVRFAPPLALPHFESIFFRRTPAADFQVGGRSYGVFAPNWQLGPVDEWLKATGHGEAGRERSRRAAPPEPRSLAPETLLPVVRQAPRDFTRLDVLASNPLLQSTLLPPEDRTPAGIQATLRRAVESLNSNPKDARLYRALRVTYLEPVARASRCRRSRGWQRSRRWLPRRVVWRAGQA